MVQSFGRPMQLLKSEVDQFQGFALYVREGFPTYKRRNYDFGFCEVIVAGYVVAVTIFVCSACAGILIGRIIF